MFIMQFIISVFSIMEIMFIVSMVSIMFIVSMVSIMFIISIMGKTKMTSNNVRYITLLKFLMKYMIKYKNNLSF
jgi:hypothetical protein